MFGQLLTKIVGTQNDRELKRLRPRVAVINAFEDRIKALSDEQLRGKTTEFRTRLANGETIEELLPEAFAVVPRPSRRRCNASLRRSADRRHRLHNARSPRLIPGEGKLVATFPRTSPLPQGLHMSR